MMPTVPLVNPCSATASASQRLSSSRHVSVPRSSTRAGRSGQRRAAAANAYVGAMFSRRAAAAIRRYLSGRMGAMNPERRSVDRSSRAPFRRSVAAISAENWPPPLTAELGERVLHHLAHVCVDGGDVWVLAELRCDVNRFENLGNDLGRQRQVRRQEAAEAEAEGQADRYRQRVQAGGFGDPAEPLHQADAARQVELIFLAADGNNRHDGHTCLDGGSDIACPPVEVDDMLLTRRPTRVVVAAREDHHDMT